MGLQRGAEYAGNVQLRGWRTSGAVQVRSLRGAGAGIRGPAGRRNTGAVAPSHRRKRLPGDVRIKIDAGLGLDEEVPVGHRLLRHRPRRAVSTRGALGRVGLGNAVDPFRGVG